MPHQFVLITEVTDEEAYGMCKHGVSHMGMTVLSGEQSPVLVQSYFSEINHSKDQV